MKKLRFAFLALTVSIFTYAFTPSPEKASFATYYAFDALGNLIGSASSIAALKAAHCPGANQIFCAQVWTSKDAQNRPAGTRLDDIMKPN